ncbi:alpha/beta fold hydrolase [Xenophilus arseniciresistens]|uniref:Alpha/beta fold hydrolase n=1 Tax=Xenophilus arseniciresistens TaxID=1283306 RepID=A0AAE3NC65_9BURK|nr:alpha/beta fold hydrolase [Xenophilus arseniciresistens]MDA7418878.1 alpha/beta fold hydrolase [Xenophilus arseniciresistens]
MLDYRTPRWLPGGNLQTIWPALWSRRHEGPAPVYARERWDTPDGDFIDVDLQPAPAGAANAPLLVLFHGLEGSSRSHYALAFAAQAAACGMAFAVPHFRGCGGSINLAPRAYHSGDHEEIGWILKRFAARRHDAPVLAVGVSLGGNALLRWAEEAGGSAAQTVRAVAAVSAPLDLAAGGAAIGRGFNRQVYTRMFLNTMKPKALAKLAQHPGLFDRGRLLAARDLHDFDDVFTAPLHGFAGVQDYWRRASAKPHLRAIRVPALVLNARNDPFVPGASLPTTTEVGPHVTLWQPAHGGHVGFALGRPPGHVRSMPQAVTGWLRAHL